MVSRATKSRAVQKAGRGDPGAQSKGSVTGSCHPLGKPTFRLVNLVDSSHGEVLKFREACCNLCLPFAFLEVRRATPKIFPSP
ncbi:hypothetical protein Nepgr_022732 [Nepenthes gracilis]|uniref:Uncharacterized protein n=1 Tax=Nepenthes gracilis TaxID=150966 RepID=A0AAD3T194_NEPGR|nr:hypothetical protein Nepgr_022732 [Nepenthes gracilis]